MTVFSKYNPSSLRNILHNIMSEVKRRRLTRLYSRAKHKYRLASKTVLYWVPEQNKHEVRAGLRRYAIRLTVLEEKNTRIDLLFFWVAITIAIIPFFWIFISPFSSAELRSLTAVPPDFFNSVVALAIYFVPGLIAVILGPILNGSVRSVVGTIVAFGVGGAVAATSTSQTGFPAPWKVVSHGSTELYILTFFTLGCAQIIVLYCLALLSSLVTDRRLLLGAPAYKMVDELTLAMSHLAGRRMEFTDVTNRREIIRHLERAATYLDQGLPRATAIPNPGGQSFLADRCHRSASAIRELEIQVALPGVDTLEELKRTIANIVEIVVQGRYDLLPTTISADESINLVRRIASIARSFVVAIIPAVTLIILRFSGLKLTSQFNNWAIVVVTVWGAVTFISLLDPLYSNRIKTVQDFVSAFRGTSAGR
jgi:hypothetical protein